MPNQQPQKVDLILRIHENSAGIHKALSDIIDIVYSMRNRIVELEQENQTLKMEKISESSKPV
jgi:hypothetical protein